VCHIQEQVNLRLFLDIDQSMNSIQEEFKSIFFLYNSIFQQGALMLVRTDKFTQAVSIRFASEMMKRLEKFSATETMSKGKFTSAIGQSSHVWTKESLVSKIVQEVNNICLDYVLYV
jgi:hypothetical protein